MLPLAWFEADHRLAVVAGSVALWLLVSQKHSAPAPRSSIALVVAVLGIAAVIWNLCDSIAGLQAQVQQMQAQIVRLQIQVAQAQSEVEVDAHSRNFWNAAAMDRLELAVPAQPAPAPAPSEILYFLSRDDLNQQHNRELALYKFSQRWKLDLPFRHAHNITRLTLAGNRLFPQHLSADDLEALTLLGNLTTLDLSFSSLSDLGFVRHMPNLKVLKLRQTHIRDLSMLRYAQRLRELDLSWTHIDNIEPLASLADLAVLDLSFTRIADLSDLARLDSLVDLNLFWTRIDSVAPLSGLRKLKRLNLGLTRVASLEPIGLMRQLEELETYLLGIRPSLINSVINSHPRLKKAIERGYHE
ncbi:uncharacterized protein BJ171DRAFT_583972 [Polychytrium aggregatum]|uniref:uncharacterized protein n=1 Tax=Polychytrium aggregatum TaxID=110093 RepID=UPI0022FE7F45|nr:uncharacterized protein BJ171DRAFT_583972 [Polychytrium aggregatum]KAI9202580.1 hypothetical protein BJ171DRAFT_583972 [Polychytrium aggregatum]